MKAGDSKHAAPGARTLADFLVSRRKALGLTQRQVAKRAGISQQQVSALESSDRGAGLDTVAGLASALNASVDLVVQLALGNPVKWEDRGARAVIASERKTVWPDPDTELFASWYSALAEDDKELIRLQLRRLRSTEHPGDRG